MVHQRPQRRIAVDCFQVIAHNLRVTAADAQVVAFGGVLPHWAAAMFTQAHSTTWPEWHFPSHVPEPHSITMRSHHLGLSLVFALLPAALGAQAPLVFRDVRVFDGERVVGQRSVRVERGLIAHIGDASMAVPTGATVIDGRGRTLLPGLIDAHVHLSDSAEADLRQAASLGVTTVLDMFSAGSRFERLKALRAADRPHLADLRTAGTGASAPRGHPSQMGGPPFAPVTDSAMAAGFVADRVAEGSDYIKIIYDDLRPMGYSAPMLDRPTLQALVVAAHAHGQLAVVHVMSEEHARHAIEAGADGLVHLFLGEPAAPGFAELAAARGVFVVPTLSVLDGTCGHSHGARVALDSLLMPYVRASLHPLLLLPRRAQPDPPSCDGARDAMRQLVKAGVPVLMGTDAPSPGHTYGASLHTELALAVEAGLTPLQALHGATAAAATAFRLLDRGLVAVGLRADLVLVEGDPTQEIAATRRIVGVWKQGVAVERMRH